MSQQESGTSRPRVSVIVPVLNGLEDLRGCVEALLAQDYPAELVEIVVADNGSATWPEPYLPVDPRLRVISAPGGGSYAARNAALAQAGGAVIAFTDADCSPDPHWLSAAVEALAQEPAADMVGGAIDLRFAAGRPVSAAEWYEYLHGFPQQEYLTRGFAVTANLVTWRTVVDRVGPFDASLASGGDAEWCRRVRDSGGIQRYAPGAVVRHPARATRAQLLAKSRRTTQGVVTKELRRPHGRLYLLRALTRLVARVLRRTGTVWRAEAPRPFSAKVSYLALFWANAAVMGAEIVRTVRANGGPGRA